MQHILTGCGGTPGGGDTRRVLVKALREMEAAVPLTTQEHVQHNRAYRKVIYEARMRLQAGDAATLDEQRWRHLERVLAGCVPEFGRNEEVGVRRQMVRNVVAAVQRVQEEAARAVEKWQAVQRGAVERRKEAERIREVLRTVCLAWREVADRRQARSVAWGGRAGDTVGGGWLSGREGVRDERHPCTLGSQKAKTHTSQVHGARVGGRDPYKETGVYATAQEVKGSRMLREQPRSAVPAGSQARMLMTWLRLTGGPEKARRLRDRKAWEGKRPREERVAWVRGEQEEHTEWGPTSKDGGRLRSRVHTAEEQGTEAMSRAFAQANAAWHRRGDRVAGNVGGQQGGTGAGAGEGDRVYTHREGWKGAETQEQTNEEVRGGQEAGDVGEGEGGEGERSAQGREWQGETEEGHEGRVGRWIDEMRRQARADPRRASWRGGERQGGGEEGEN